MIKEFERLIDKMEVQINLSAPTQQEKGLHAKIIFIPLVKDLPLKNLIPIEVWGTSTDVENSIRYNLEMMNTALDVGDNVKKERAAVKKKTKAIKKEIVAKTGVPEENIIVSSMKTINTKVLPKEDMKLRKAMIEDEEKAEKKAAIDEAPKDADNYMIEEELRKNPPKVKNITPEEAFGKDDPAKDYIAEQLNEDDEPEWMRQERESMEKKLNESGQTGFQF